MTPDRAPAGSRIVSAGHYLPSEVVTTAQVADRLGIDEEWAISRTGIRERRVAHPDETVVDMAEMAGRRALDACPSAESTSVDTVIVATSTPETTMPSVAARVASRLGLSQPAAFDVNAACAGFCHVLAVADAMVRGGVASGVLVIGADKGSAWLDWDDRDTALLFADGAGAVVVAPHEVPGIGPVLWGSLGDRWDLVGIDPKSRTLRQNGRAVFRWAISLGPLVEQICARTGVRPDDLSVFIPHQANLRIIRTLAKAMPEQVLTSTDVVDTGNTIGATIPIALSRMLARYDHPVRGGQALLFGFGAGLTYAGQIVTIP